MKIETLFTDRNGGTSLPPFDSFNIAMHIGDNTLFVEKNRDILKRKTGSKKLYFMEQVHKNRVCIIDEMSPETTSSCDALVTDRPGRVLVVMVADCIPLLLYDESRGIAAAVHAGREGTLLNISTKCVDVMQKRFNSKAQDIKAKLGPSIHSCCYEVSKEIAETVTKRFGSSYMNGRYLDLQALNRDQLTAAGLKRENIEISGLCTCCNENYFSYRREGVTGRFVGAIWINNRVL